jgi:hypothetical protein
VLSFLLNFVIIIHLVPLISQGETTGGPGSIGLVLSWNEENWWNVWANYSTGIIDETFNQGNPGGTVSVCGGLGRICHGAPVRGTDNRRE